MKTILFVTVWAISFYISRQVCHFGDLKWPHHVFLNITFLCSVLYSCLWL